MKLYKNVDIVDLQSIFSKGILSISDLGFSNWEESKLRADNSEEVVYLFAPKSNINSFPSYGTALLEIEVEDALLNTFSDNDYYKDKYEEYIVKYVSPASIKKVYIPKIFEKRIDKLMVEGIDIAYCEIEADEFIIYDEYNCKGNYLPVVPSRLEMFSKTASLMVARK